MTTAHTLRINEIYLSVQGESSFAGLPCWFIRLAGCPLRCKWCDTAYAFGEGDPRTIDSIISEIAEKPVQLVELTGGEPLAQENATELVRELSHQNYQILIETSGSQPIAPYVNLAHMIMDIKCPDSKMSQHNLYENISFLKPSDEVKFVIASRADFDWCQSIIKQYDLKNVCKILVSPAWGLIKEEQLVNWMLEDNLPARLNLQQHKYIWGPRKRGV